jgi:hypothetical protein
MIAIKDVTLLIEAGTPERQIAGSFPWSELDRHLEFPFIEDHSWRLHGFRVLDNDDVELYAHAVRAEVPDAE